jgi:nitroreductase
MDTHEAIARRTSSREFKPDPLPRWAVERLLAAAVRAPNHKLTEPWRFVVLTGDARLRYADIRKAHRAKKFDDPSSPEAQKAIEKTYREHQKTPVFVFVLMSLSDDPVRREEDYGAVMMATQNLLVAAAADGIGTWLRTGGIMDLPEVRALVSAKDSERIVGIVSAGYLAGEPEPTPRRKPLGELITWLE